MRLGSYLANEINLLRKCGQEFASCGCRGLNLLCGQALFSSFLCCCSCVGQHLQRPWRPVHYLLRTRCDPSLQYQGLHGFHGKLVSVSCTALPYPPTCITFPLSPFPPHSLLLSLFLSVRPSQSSVTVPSPSLTSECGIPSSLAMQVTRTVTGLS